MVGNSAPSVEVRAVSGIRAHHVATEFTAHRSTLDALVCGNVGKSAPLKHLLNSVDSSLAMYLWNSATLGLVAVAAHQILASSRELGVWLAPMLRRDLYVGWNRRIQGVR